MVNALGNEKAPIKKTEPRHLVDEIKLDRSDQDVHTPQREAMVNVNFTAPYSTHRTMKRLAFEADRPVREVYLEAVKRYISDQESSE